MCVCVCVCEYWKLNVKTAEICVDYKCNSLFPGTVKGIPEEGMPNFRRPHMKGNLYIEFDVEFPECGFLEERELMVQCSSALLN